MTPGIIEQHCPLSPLMGAFFFLIIICYNKSMDEIDILKKAGLSETQAEVYNCLLKNGAMTPTEISKKTGQSRENCYMVAKKLVELSLIEQTNDKKSTYRVLNPTNLEVLAEKRRKITAKNEKAVKDNISLLLDIFYANNEMPGARTLEGIDGIKEVYNDVLRVKKDVYLLRTTADSVLGKDEISESFLKKYRDQLPILGIHTYALTPVTKEAIKYAKTGRDDAILFHRTWMPEEDYTSPMALQIYGNKVALIAFGDTQMATLITSPVIAEAMRQILKIMIKFYQKDFAQEY